MERGIFEAVLLADAGRLRELLKQGEDPNQVRDFGENQGPFFSELTPLMVAVGARASNAEIVRALLDAGADVHAVSVAEVTAAWYAAGGMLGFRYHHWSGDAMEAVDPEGIWGGGDAERLRLLLDASADPQECADNGRSLVFEACAAGDPQRLSILLERGASPHPQPPRYHFGQESWPLTSGWPEFLQASGLGNRPDGSLLCVPLFAAAASGNVECVRLIVESGVNPRFTYGGDYPYVSEDGYYFAGSPEIVDLLADLGVPQSDEEDYPYNDAGDTAIDHGLPEVARRIWERQTRKSLDGEFLSNRLYHYIYRQDERGVKTLLGMGADINRLNNRGQTPLIEAAIGGHPGLCEMLLKLGAKVDFKDKHGLTARDYAEKNLRSCNADIENPVRRWFTERFDRLLGMNKEASRQINIRAREDFEKTVEVFHRD